MPERAALYMRVSTSEQAQEGDSIPAQREALNKYVKDNKLKLVGEYIDGGTSGTKADREELQRLLDDIRADKIDRILFTKLDRWFRSVRHYTATQEILDKHKTTWTAIWEPIYDTSTPSGRLIVNQMMSIAQFEAENTSLRIRQVFDYKLHQKEVTTGNQPFGFSIKDKHLVPNEDAEKVRKIFDYYLETGSLYQTWGYASSIGYSRAQSTLRSMLTTEKYVGRHKGVEGFCPAIVDPEVFEEVQRRLSMNIKCDAKITYIFTGLCKCAECGSSLGAYRNRCTGKNGQIWRNSYYRCCKYYKRDLAGCTNKTSISERNLENQLLTHIRPEAQTFIQQVESTQKETRNVEKEIAALQKKIERLTDLYVNELIDMDKYKADRQQFLDEIDRLQQDTVSAPSLEAAKIAAEFDFERLYPTLSKEEKRLFWRSIIKEIKVFPDKSISIIFL